ncbi:calcium uniporter mitochondrial isoform X2 [Brachionus plicatilis]|uniref:Calcium uniporter protein n=1 Tax=Brachionus plicatilis TaxID=10195 RepID=A0A3M7P7E8_BRAPC|nr:calcium uniporter mitochondrial isoform X2 [Brachionus plicatilis]
MKFILYKNLNNFSKIKSISNLFCGELSRLNLPIQSKNLFSTDIDKSSSGNQSVQIKPNGIVKLVVPLPARKENCEFTLKFLNENVGDLIEKIMQEDRSIDKIVFYTNEGNRISQSTAIGSIIYNEFKIKINDDTLIFKPPVAHMDSNEANLHDDARNELDRVRELVSKLYLQLNVEQFEAEKEKKISDEIEKLKSDLEPLENVRRDLEQKAKRHTNRMIWLGLGLMSMQAGILARLTWFDYSWDIVEPISYFVSYSAVIGVYAYYVLTRKEYGYESASDRVFLRHFHKNAMKNDLDIKKYNQIKDSIFYLENDLKNVKKSNFLKAEK